MTNQTGFSLFSLDGTSWSRAITPANTKNIPCPTKTRQAARIIHLGSEREALFGLFAHSPKACKALAGMTARRLVEDGRARGTITSDPIVYTSLETPFQHSIDVLGPISRASEMTEEQIKAHLIENANPVFFLRIFEILKPCKTHEMIAAGWINSRNHEGFSFKDENDQQQTWVDSAWIRRNTPVPAPIPHP